MSIGRAKRKTRIVRDTEYATTLREVLHRIASLRAAINNGSVAYDSNNETLITQRTITALANVSFDDESANVIFGLIRSACLQCELLCGESSGIALGLICEICENIATRLCSGENIDVIRRDLEYEISGLLQSIIDATTTSTYAQAREMIEVVYDERISGIVLDAVELAGMNGSINLEKAIGAGDTIIELVNGYRWNIVPVVNLSADVAWSRSNVLLLIVDGRIDSVSEMHRIFEFVNERKDPLLICAREFSDDVKSTIVTNRLRGTLDVHPVSIGYDIGTINSLKDIAIACGTDVKSSLKGDVISMIDPKSLSRVDSVHVLGSELTVENSSTSGAVKSHIAQLEIRRSSDELVDDVRDVYSRRIRNMLGTHVEIRINGTPRGAHDSWEMIDSALRYFRSIMSDGVVTIPALRSSFCNLDSHMSTLPHIEGVVSAQLVATVLRHSFRISKVIALSDAVVCDA